ncbi:MAG: EpsI family protein [Bryobacteraceae bacterium]
MPGDNHARTGNKYTAALTAVLLVQATLFYVASRSEAIPDGRPLESFPSGIGDFQLIQSIPIEQEVRDQLRADDLLNRFYTKAGTRVGVNMFVAYFKTQRTGQSPHSPKNCLPGTGWEPESTGFINVPVSGEAQPIRINRYIVSRGDEHSLVLYWYQNQRRVIATEFSARLWLVMDSIRYHRSDTALVRVTVPVINNDTPSATNLAVSFVQSMFPVLKNYLPV